MIINNSIYIILSCGSSAFVLAYVYRGWLGIDTRVKYACILLFEIYDKGIWIQGSMYSNKQLYVALNEMTKVAKTSCGFINDHVALVFRQDEPRAYEGCHRDLTGAWRGPVAEQQFLVPVQPVGTAESKSSRVVAAVEVEAALRVTRVTRRPTFSNVNTDLVLFCLRDAGRFRETRGRCREDDAVGRISSCNGSSGSNDCGL